MTDSVILPLGSLGGRQLTSILVVVTLVMTGGDRPLGRLAMVVTSMDGTASSGTGSHCQSVAGGWNQG